MENIELKTTRYYDINDILQEFKCKECGILIKQNKNKLCRTCYTKSRRKTQRPPKEQLIQEIKLLGYRGTGEKYGVSDTAIRKWLKNY